MPRKTGALVKNCQPRETFVAPRPDVKNTEKQDQREILKSRDIRQVHNKRRVEVDCQKRGRFAEGRRVFLSCTRRRKWPVMLCVPARSQCEPACPFVSVPNTSAVQCERKPTLNSRRRRASEKACTRVDKSMLRLVLLEHTTTSLRCRWLQQPPSGMEACCSSPRVREVQKAARRNRRLKQISARTERFPRSAQCDSGYAHTEVPPGAPWE